MNFSETRPKIELRPGENLLRLEHEQLGSFIFDTNCDQLPEVLFTENETNLKKLYDQENDSPYYKDAFHEYIIHKREDAVNRMNQGTKAALHYTFSVDGHSSRIFYFRLCQIGENEIIPKRINEEEIFHRRKTEADLFYESIYEGKLTDDEKNILRQAYAGLLHTKQFYHFVVTDWIEGENKYFMPTFSDQREKTLKNVEWRHM